MMTPAGHIRVC